MELGFLLNSVFWIGILALALAQALSPALALALSQTSLLSIGLFSS
jgi:hypothetical protein